MENNRFIIKKAIPPTKISNTQTLRQVSINNITQQPQKITSSQQSQKQGTLISKSNLQVQIPVVQQQQQQQKIVRQDTLLNTPKEKEKEIDQSDSQKEELYKEIRSLKQTIHHKDQQLFAKDFQLQSKEKELENAKSLVAAKDLQSKKLELELKKLQREFLAIKDQLEKKKEEPQVENPPPTQTPFDQNVARSMMMALELHDRERRAQAMQYYNFMQEAFQPQTNNDPNFVDTDNMTYEQLLELQEKIGHVSRGLTKEQIKKIKKQTITIMNKGKLPEICSICYSEFKMGEKYRALGCSHIYHGKCIKQWLNNEKKCPICKEEVG